MLSATPHTSKSKDKVYFPASIMKKEKNKIKFFLSKSPSKKFVQLTKALLSSKGPSCESRILTAAMRNEKGGVVDLNTCNMSKKRYSIKIQKNTLVKTKKKPIVGPKLLPKEREKAAKIIQQWWRDIILDCTTANEKIIRIQSYYRRYRVRISIIPVLQALKVIKLLSYILSPPFGLIKKECFTFIKKIYAFRYFERKKTECLIQIQRVGRKYIQSKNLRRERFSEACGRILKIIYRICYFFHQNFYMYGVLRRRKFNMVTEGYPKFRKLVNKLSVEKYYPKLKKQLLEKGKLRKIIQNVQCFYHMHKEYPLIVTKFIKWKIKPERIIRQRLTLQNFVSYLNWNRLILLMKCYKKISDRTFAPKMQAYARNIEYIKNAILKKWRGGMFKSHIIILSTYKSKQWYERVIPLLLKKVSIAIRKSVIWWVKVISFRRNFGLRTRLLKQFLSKKVIKILRHYFKHWMQINKLQNIILKTRKITEGVSLIENIKKRNLNTKMKHFLSYLIVNRFKYNRRKRILMQYIHKIQIFQKLKASYSYFAQWKGAANCLRVYDNEKFIRSKFVIMLINKVNTRYSTNIVIQHIRQWREIVMFAKANYLNDMILALLLLKKKVLVFTLMKPFAKIMHVSPYKQFLSLMVPCLHKFIFSRFKALVSLLQKRSLMKVNFGISSRMIKRISLALSNFRPLEKCFLKWIKHASGGTKKIIIFISQLQRNLHKNIYSKLIKPSLRALSKKTGVPKSYYYHSKVKRKLKNVIISNEKKNLKKIELDLLYIFKHWKKLGKTKQNNVAKLKHFLSILTFVKIFDNLKSIAAVFAKLREMNNNFEKIQKKLLRIFQKQTEVKLLSLMNRWKSFALSFYRLRNFLFDYLMTHEFRRKIIQQPIGIMKTLARITLIKKKTSCRKIVLLLRLYFKFRQNMAKKPVALENIVKLTDFKLCLKKLMCFRKWKRTDTFKKISKSANVIQIFIRSKMMKPSIVQAKRTIYFDFPTALNKLYPIFSSLMKDFEIRKHLLFLHWNRNSKIDLYNSSARTIQRFFKHISNKSSYILNRFSFLKILNGLRVFHILFLKMWLKCSFDKIQQEAKRRIMIRFLLFLRTKKQKNLEYTLDRIISYVEIKDILMNASAKKIQEKFREIKQIYKFRRSYFRLLFRKKIVLLITNNEARTKYSRLKYWKFIISHLKQEESSNAVQKFLRKGRDQKNLKQKIEDINFFTTLFRDSLILKQMKPFFKNFVFYETIQRASWHLKSHIFQIFTKKTRNVISLVLRRKLFSLVRKYETHSLHYVFQKFQMKIFNVKINEILVYIVRNADIKTKSVLITSNFMKWKNNSKKIANRDSSIFSAILALIRVQKRIMFRIFIFGIKLKYLKMVLDRISQKMYWKKLIYQMQRRNMFTAMASLLLKGSAKLQKEMKVESVRKLYTLYLYKILAKNLTQNLCECYQRKIDVMKSNFLECIHIRSAFVGTASYSLNHQAKLVDLSYRAVKCGSRRMLVNISREKLCIIFHQFIAKSLFRRVLHFFLPVSRILKLMHLIKQSSTDGDYLKDLK